MKKNLKTILIVVMVLAAGSFVPKAWAVVSFVKPQDASQQIEEAKSSEVLQNSSKVAQSRAPEPNSLVLFGTGILGMIISFIRSAYAVTKRAMDIIGSAIAMIILSPLWLLTALLIKLTSKGPVLYHQIRVGKDGQLFSIYKFRTMTVDAEKHTGPVWAKSNDNRITPLGNILRKFRIDEIPQFINVIKGDMSIIGPRPERPVFVEKLKTQITDYEMRLMVKPGITGLAQVWHRYDETIEDVRKKIKYDVLYIKRMCFWTDVQIILRTFRVVLTGAGK